MGNSESVPEMQMHTSFVLKATPTFSLKRSNTSTCKNKEAFCCQQKHRKHCPWWVSDQTENKMATRITQYLKFFILSVLVCTDTYTGCNPKGIQIANSTITCLIFSGFVIYKLNATKPSSYFHTLVSLLFPQVSQILSAFQSAHSLLCSHTL